MIKVDETDPVGDVDAVLPYRKVSIKRGEDVKKYHEMCEEIGRGKFGTVYKCKEKSTGLFFAAKFIPIPSRKERKDVVREIDMMNRLQHPKIIQLYDAYEYNKMVCVVLELIEGGELFDRVLDDKFILTEKACSIFMRQICEAMEYIHEQNIIHLDLKPENILCLTETGNRIKIIDFGLAREYDPWTKLQVLFGTPEFVAPEVVNFEAITFATDMWSVGVIAYVLVSGLSPFAGECDVETMGNVTVGKYDFNDEAFDNVSPECIDFITKLLMKEHGQRLTAKEALRHKWVKRKPQYHPTNAKPSNPLSFKAGYMDKDNSLTTAKDNLRNCVDRWNENGITPYVFDKQQSSISPIHSSISSSIEMSPSPIGSLSSCSSECLTTSDGNDDVTAINQSSQLTENSTQNHQPIISLKDYLHALERHKSIDNCFLASSSVNRMYFFDEIKQLTDHLFKLTIQPDTTNDETSTIPPTHDNELSQNANHHTNDIKIHDLNKTIQTVPPALTEFDIKLKTFKKNDDVVQQVQQVTDDGNRSMNSTSNNMLNDSIGMDDGNSEPDVGLIKGYQFSEILKRFSNFADDTLSTHISETSNAPWPVSSKRTKFRVNQMSSRDVPIISTDRPAPAKLKKQNAIDATDMRLFDEQISHKSTSSVTSKCMVNLLDKFRHQQDDNAKNHFFNIRHETFVSRLPNGSISFDCGQLGGDVEQRSINTIRQLFHLHATTGTTVRQIQAQIEGKK